MAAATRTHYNASTKGKQKESKNKAKIKNQKKGYGPDRIGAYPMTCVRARLNDHDVG